MQDFRNGFLFPEITPMAQSNGSKARIINEYGWLWLNRDGTPSKLSKLVYDYYLPEGTTEQRRELYARYLAMMTEIYRHQTKIKVAGIMHFCALTFSDPETAFTGDNYIDIEGPTFDPFFVKYVRDAFAPVGLMIELWGRTSGQVWGPEFATGTEIEVPVKVKNDSGRPWSGSIVLKLLNGYKVIQESSQELTVEETKRGEVTFKITFPEVPGEYELIAELKNDGVPVRSYRRVKILAVDK